MKGEEEEEEKMVKEEAIRWSTEKAVRVLGILSSGLSMCLSQRDLISLLLVSPLLHRTLSSSPSLWMPRYHHLRHINLEFAQGLEDLHLQLLKIKSFDSLQNLESLNLNGCQKISDKGIEAVTIACPYLKIFSIYWNVRVTDVGITHLVNNCRLVVDLNLSGCKNITDTSLNLIASNYQHLEFLNLTQCVKITDGGLQVILQKCSNLHSKSLCIVKNLSDQGLHCIAKCKELLSLNLTWCVRLTDDGVIAIAQSCSGLQFLSLFGIVGVTDKCLEALSWSCANTLTTLDVNGCIGIERRSHDELLQLLPKLRCFKVHS